MLTKKIIAIDPGYDRCGVAIFSYDTSATLLYSSCLTTSPKQSHAQRLKHIYEEVSKVIAEWKPDILAIETIFFSLNKKTVIKVSEARGVILLAAAHKALEILELSPQLIKLSTTGVGNSDKKAVQKMVAVLLKKDVSGCLDDEIDAMAIGLTACEELRIHKLLS